MSEKIIIGSDHAGYDLKSYILNFKFKKKIFFTDIGANSSLSVDYPDIAHTLAFKVNRGDFKLGILICGSGVGMSIVANRYENIRAALCLDEKMSKLARQHNDANIIVLGSRLISFSQAIKCLNTFVLTSFEKGRHELRIRKFNDFNSNRERK